MRVFWDKTGSLYAIYSLVGGGWKDDEIAAKLDTTQANVQNCVAWLLRFLGLGDRSGLCQHAAWAGTQSLALAHAFVQKNRTGMNPRR